MSNCLKLPQVTIPTALQLSLVVSVSLLVLEQRYFYRGNTFYTSNSRNLRHFLGNFAEIGSMNRKTFILFLFPSYFTTPGLPIDRL